MESLAGTGKVYKELQARVYPNEGLHLQGKGEPVNRDYGFADTLFFGAGPMDKEFLIWAVELDHSVTSLASHAAYFPIQARLRSNGTVHFQIRDGNFNRSYGAAFDVAQEDYPALVKFLEQ